MNLQFDDRDAVILQDRQALWDKRQGPRVGDFVHMLDGTLRRFTHNWGDGLQVTCGNGDNGSFYFAKGGMSYSGGLDPTIPNERIESTEETLPGAAWFFHHDHSGAHRGVYFKTPCRVFRQV